MSERRAAAAGAVGEMLAMVRSQPRGFGAQTWYLRLLDIRDVLASPAADEDVLRRWRG